MTKEKLHPLCVKIIHHLQAQHCNLPKQDELRKKWLGKETK